MRARGEDQAKRYEQQQQHSGLISKFLSECGAVAYHLFDLCAAAESDLLRCYMCCGGGDIIW